MTSTTIRKTCDDCQQIVQMPATSLILTLPSPTCDESEDPSFVYFCPACRACVSSSLSWRAAGYLLDGGATVLTAPDVEELRPRHPERRPADLGPMSLDDLIDLHAALTAADHPL